MEARQLISQIKADNVKFITLQFTDILGVIKEVLIPAHKVDSAFTDGLWFDGSSIEGFTRIQESDLFLKPDPETYVILKYLLVKTREWNQFEMQVTKWEIDRYLEIY